ncbi:MAG: hypothetical protein KIS94_12125 [Chitinophagales bacterium]|nr:hypothetical protein [Chitinophagales bacterium]
MQQFPVRYGQIWKVVVAMVAPPLVTVAPFVQAMRQLPSLPEWAVYAVIFAFLGLLFSFTLWLVLSIYPKALLQIGDDEIYLIFDASNWLHPRDFSIKMNNITYMSAQDAVVTDSVQLKAKNPYRRFRLSARSYNADDYAAFNEAVELLRGKINEVN